MFQWIERCFKDLDSQSWVSQNNKPITIGENEDKDEDENEAEEWRRVLITKAD